MKEELDTLVRRRVVITIDESTLCASQNKWSGKLRLCIDPHTLNEALMREHYKLQNIDDAHIERVQ